MLINCWKPVASTNWAEFTFSLCSLFLTQSFLTLTQIINRASLTFSTQNWDCMENMQLITLNFARAPIPFSDSVFWAVIIGLKLSPHFFFWRENKLWWAVFSHISGWGLCILCLSAWHLKHCIHPCERFSRVYHHSCFPVHLTETVCKNWCAWK